MENLTLLKKLCSANGISGCENSVREIIIDEIKDNATNITVDNLGNLIVFKKDFGIDTTVIVTCRKHSQAKQNRKQSNNG